MRYSCDDGGKRSNLRFQRIFSAGKLISTISSNTASDERIFFPLKRINSYFRGLQSQERLCGLSLISTEKVY